MSEKLIRVDRNGTKYFESDVCPKCGGRGVINEYYFNQAGRCFLCEGTGKHIHRWKEYTPEYAQKLADKRLAKAKKQAAEANKRFFDREGFNEDGVTWCVAGDTYSIKDELKEAGAKYSNILGWHFDHETEYKAFQVNADDVMTVDWAGRYNWYENLTEVATFIKELRDTNAPESKSMWAGKQGEKIAVKAACEFITYWETAYGDQVMYKFRDGAGNVFVWKTTWRDIDEGKTYNLTGTIKELGEFRGEKQTVLTRCKVTEA